MIIAIGGDDPRAARWIAPIAKCGAAAVPVEGSAVARLDEMVIPSGSAVGRSDSTLPDAAILGGGLKSILQAARSVGEQTPLLILPAAQEAAAIAYAFIPAVEDGRKVVPGWLHRGTRSVDEVLRRIAVGELGDVQLVRMEATVAVPESTLRGLTQADVDSAFFNQVDLLRLVGGDFSRITAVAVGAQGELVHRMTVTLAGETTAEAVWSLMPGTEAGWHLTITGTRSSVELRCDSTEAIVLCAGEQSIAETPEEAAGVLVGRLFGEVSDASTTEGIADRSCWGNWNDYVRAADLLQGMHRSLRRRRTIDLHFESTSERSQFKTQMTAIGCGVLAWALLGLCVGLILGRVLDPRSGAERRAITAGTIVWATDFSPDGTELNPATLQRLVRQIEVDGQEAIILIENSSENGINALDSARLENVVAGLKSSAEGKLIPQVQVVRLSGQWFVWGMRLIWGITFAPLAIFLFLQLLITVTRSRTI